MVVTPRSVPRRIEQFSQRELVTEFLRLRAELHDKGVFSDEDLDRAPRWVVERWRALRAEVRRRGEQLPLF